MTPWSWAIFCWGFSAGVLAMTFYSVFILDWRTRRFEKEEESIGLLDALDEVDDREILPGCWVFEEKGMTNVGSKKQDS